MELRFVHFYPDLMNLYGSWGNVALLRRHLEDLGNTVTVDMVAPGGQADLSGADFIFMGAGTEWSQKAALGDFTRFGDALRDAAGMGTAMLFCGTAMELLGRAIIDDTGKAFEGIALADFTSVQEKHRIVGDVYGQTDLYPSAVVGFMNKCSHLLGVETPLLTSLSMGFGNEADLGPEGFHRDGVFASQLTGPILVKNPLLLRAVMDAVYRRRGQSLPESLPAYPFEEQGYEITAQQLKLRSESVK